MPSPHISDHNLVKQLNWIFYFNNKDNSLAIKDVSGQLRQFSVDGFIYDNVTPTFPNFSWLTMETFGGQQRAANIDIILTMVTVLTIKRQPTEYKATLHLSQAQVAVLLSLKYGGIDGPDHWISSPPPGPSHSPFTPCGRSP